MEGDCTKTLLITANIASIFEEPETLFEIWLKSFYQCVQTHKPGLLAIHCQEVGGKNYEASMQHVNHFIKTLLGCEELHRYDRARIFLDEDYTASDKFTALGNLYFVHEEVADVLIWDFVDCMFVEVEGREVLSGNIENVPIKEKAKFPQYFFPEFKWSRKGFIRTRWSINNCIFDLINIHLFHDASNIIAMESSPSVYSTNRQRALLHTLQRFENDKYSKVPFFIFGDFNFRLDSNLLIQELTQKLVSNETKGKKDQVKKIEYSEEGNGKTVLTIESKSFDYYDKHTDLFANMVKWINQFDSEVSQFRDRLYEFDVSFPPSYPFCEGLSDGVTYMKTRVPSWCDRILLSHTSKDILSQDPSHQGVYNIIGKGVCMGDHKPVYLFVHMKPGKGKLEKQFSLDIASPRSTSSSSDQIRPRTLSINGEPVNFSKQRSSKVDLTEVNIHDFAVFEKEQELIPEFRVSIKSRNSVDMGDSSSPNHMSAKDRINKVLQMEKVLLNWPRLSRTRHHSSSSEDMKTDDESESVSSSQKSDNGPVDSSSKDVDSERSPKQGMGVVANENNNYVRDSFKAEDKAKTVISTHEITLTEAGVVGGEKDTGVRVADCPVVNVNENQNHDVHVASSSVCPPGDATAGSATSSLRQEVKADGQPSSATTRQSGRCCCVLM